MTYTISFESNPSQKDLQVLDDGIIEYAAQQKGQDPIELFSFFIRDKNNKIMGGCGGEMMYGHLYIGHLWIAASLRGQGYGRALMKAVEELALKNKCNFMAVNTFDWEALDFYKRFGFFVEFERHGFLHNSVFYYLRKNISPELIVYIPENKAK